MITSQLIWYYFSEIRRMRVRYLNIISNYINFRINSCYPYMYDRLLFHETIKVMFSRDYTYLAFVRYLVWIFLYHKNHFTLHFSFITVVSTIPDLSSNVLRSWVWMLNIGSMKHCLCMYYVWMQSHIIHVNRKFAPQWIKVEVIAM